MDYHRLDHHRLTLSVLLPGFSGTTPPQWLLEATGEGLAGVVLFAQNTPDLPTTKTLTEALHQINPHLLVTLDEEGGDVTRLQASTGSSLPGAAAFGAAADPELTYQGGRALGALLRASGVDMNLAPVLDVASEPRNPVIGVRSFGPDPEQVSAHGSAYMSGLQAGGVATCAKHFPGHGDTTVDSHVSLPTVEASMEVLAARDLPPFQHAAARGLDSVMTAHLNIPAVGPFPASLEPAVTQLVRDLPGGENIAIITDALDMGAVAGAEQETFGEACIRALEAGADLLCLGSTAGRDDEAMFRSAYQAVYEALTSGRLSPELLWRAVSRAHRLADKARAYRESAPELSAEEALDAVAEVGRIAAQRSAQLVHGDLPSALHHKKPVLVDLRRRISQAAGRISPGFWRAVQSRNPDAGLLTPGEPGSAPVEELVADLDPQAQILVLTREPLADPAEQQMLTEVLSSTEGSIVIHGGTAHSAPTALQGSTLILAHGVGRANAEAVMRLIYGD